MSTILQNSVLKVLHLKGAITRRDLIKELGGCPRTTVYDNLLKLQKQKLVYKFSKNNHDGRGRPLVYWRLK